MEFRIHKSEFVRGLRLAQSIADRKSTMPMLANVLLRVQGGDRRSGKLLVAATERGLCRVELGTQDSALLEDLRREFPEAHSIERDDAALGRFVTELLHRIDGAAPREDLPLDIQATAFQRRVYEELLRIPTGETRSYAEIAEAIGQPTASRAVGNACATNPVALAIPCHRVLRNNGTLGGYAWGIERKQALISAERRTARRAG